MSTVAVNQPESTTTTDGSRLLERITLGLLIAAHVVAVFQLIPPGELLRSDPILGADHPAHAHRVYVYREALWLGTAPWGYDPAVGAGVVMRPTQDAGAKPQEFLGALLPALSEGSVIKVFLLISALLAPLWTLLAARRLGLPLSACLWIGLVLIAPMWLYQNLQGFYRWGLSAFAFASYLSPLVLVLFLKFLDRPSWKSYLAAVLVLSIQMMLHVLGPVVIAPSLAVLALTARPLPGRWRAAAILAPLLPFAVNAFWLVPFLLDFGTPSPPGRDFTYYPPDLTYHSVEHLLTMISPARLVALLTGVGAASFGFVIMRKYVGTRATIAFALAALTGLALKFGGSFLPVVVTMQPARFLIGGFVCMTLPIGLAAYWLASKMRIPHSAGVVSLGLAAVLLAAHWRDKPVEGRKDVNYAGQTINEAPTFMGLPESVPLPGGFSELEAFVQEHTQPDDRLLIQTRIQAEPKILAALWSREVLGNIYPDAHDPANFLRDTLWGRKLDDWSPEELLQALDRWGVAWVFTTTEKATALFTEVSGQEGILLGPYHAFAVEGDTDRFLVGKGTVATGVNRLILDDLEPEDGLVVLRYRYHPALRVPEGVEVFLYEIPEAASGFIGLRAPAPPKHVEIRFEPTAIFSAKWPAKPTPNRP